MAEETVVLGTEPTIAEYKASREAAAKAVEAKEAAPAEVEQVDESEDAEAGESQDKPKVKGGFQKRIDRLIKQVASTEEQLATERKRVAELEARTGKEAPKQADPESDEPQRDKFASDLDYFRALTRWEVRQENKMEAERARRAELEEKQQDLNRKYNERVIEAKANHDDFDEVLSQNMAIPSLVGAAILRMANGPEVAYQLGKNPEICEELMAMDEIEAVGKVWELFRELSPKTKESAEEDDEKPKKTRVPPPIRAISSGTTRTTTVPIDKASISDYKRRTSEARKTNQVRSVR